jgi:hypothetical protein
MNAKNANNRWALRLAIWQKGLAVKLPYLAIANNRK